MHRAFQQMLGSCGIEELEQIAEVEAARPVGALAFQPRLDRAAVEFQPVEMFANRLEVFATQSERKNGVEATAKDPMQVGILRRVPLH